MESEIQNSISTEELYKEYDWYQRTFPQNVQQSCNDFFGENFALSLVGLSKNINCMLENESCFVTKIRFDEKYELFFRLTDTAIEIILDKILGMSKSKFNINKISELEAKVITAFNGFMFESLKKQLNDPNPVELKRTNFDVVHLTFIIKDADTEFAKRAGKVIVTLPLALVNPEMVESSSEKFENDDFPESETNVKILVGSTKFSVYDMKNLEKEDVVVFEDSHIDSLKVAINGEELDVNINPNMDLLIPETNNGGDNMAGAHKNIWDSIEVEMNAEFDAVKITLGELKNIEDGLVVDLASLYDNKVTLKVEGKPIASGSLVIVNDRYGVKIDNVIAQNKTPNISSEDVPEEESTESNEEEEENQEYSDEEENSEETNSEEGKNGEEDFDYSDFELEDENI